MAIKKMCPRCRRVIEHSQRYCVECTARMNRDYDRTARDKNSKAFYNSDPWLKVRRIVLEKYHGLDIYQYRVYGRVVYADTVHHIEELRENPTRALDVDNLIPLSDRSHKEIHGLYRKSKEEKKATQKVLFDIINNQ